MIPRPSPNERDDPQARATHHSTRALQPSRSSPRQRSAHHTAGSSLRHESRSSSPTRRSPSHSTRRRSRSRPRRRSNSPPQFSSSRGRSRSLPRSRLPPPPHAASLTAPASLHAAAPPLHAPTAAAAPSGGSAQDSLQQGEQVRPYINAFLKLYLHTHFSSISTPVFQVLLILLIL